MDTGRRGFFKRLLGLGALAAAGKFVGKAEVLPKVVTGITKANPCVIGFSQAGNTFTVPGTITYCGSWSASGFSRTDVIYIGGNGNG